ncbi:MAG: alpha/beta fold hydrolase [Thermoguttaceae bacterium]
MFNFAIMIKENIYCLVEGEVRNKAGKIKRVMVAALSLLAIFSQSIASAGEDPKHVEMAKTFVTQMAGGQFDKAVEPFDQTMSQALPAESLKQIWDGLIKENGAFQRITETRTEKYLQYEMVFVTCEFKQGMLDAKVVFTSGNKIAGLFFLPSGKYKPPSYADFSKFEEKEIQIGKGIWSLPGALSLPKGDGPFPAVILVHGSGPQDRDETIGPNKPFRDLAHGLASRGIAVLRYEKRTKEHQIMMAMMTSNITVKEETVDDVVSAVEALASQDMIDSKRIVVLGHSLGGMLIPRIAQAQDKISGFISLAGSTRPLEDLVLEQTRYIMSQDGKLNEEAQKKIKELERQVADIKSPDLSEKNPGALLLGGPAKYWLDLRGYEPAKEAVKLRQPMLILQGERDYQTTMENFANWKNALGSRKDVSFITYPNLNHLFIEGKGKSLPEEYSIPGNVAKAVIDDIVKWIAAINPARK